MKNLFLLTIAICLTFAACNKPKYRDVEWYVTDTDFAGSSTYPEPIDTTIDFHEILGNDKVMKLSNAVEFNSFLAHARGRSIGGKSLYDSPLGDVDFNEETIFVLEMWYGTQCDETCGTVSGGKVRVSDFNDKICFSFSIKAPVGGSGMINLKRYFFIVVPNDAADYEVSGIVRVDEKGGLFGRNADDYAVRFEQ